MTVPPLPWTDVMRGGHLTQNTMVARTKGFHKRLLVEAHKRGEMEQFYKALSVLGEVPW